MPTIIAAAVISTRRSRIGPAESAACKPLMPAWRNSRANVTRRVGFAEGATPIATMDHRPDRPASARSLECCCAGRRAVHRRRSRRKDSFSFRAPGLHCPLGGVVRHFEAAVGDIAAPANATGYSGSPGRAHSCHSPVERRVEERLQLTCSSRACSSAAATLIGWPSAELFGKGPRFAPASERRASHGAPRRNFRRAWLQHATSTTVGSMRHWSILWARIPRSGPCRRQHAKKPQNHIDVDPGHWSCRLTFSYISRTMPVMLPGSCHAI